VNVVADRPIVIVDDHQVLAQSLGYALRALGVAAEVPELTDAATLVATIESVNPSLVLLDLDLGGALGDATSLIGPLVASGDRCVLVLSGTPDRDRFAAALEAGATGFVEKGEPFDVLLQTTLRAARGEQVTPPEERHVMLAALRRHREIECRRLEPFERLTSREAEVLVELAHGRCVTTIAEQWFVAVPTVRAQVRGVLAKLDVSSQLEAVALAVDTGWFDRQTVSVS
jgi:DNA-binding NarL/FixJ family response regulator